ncbi:hypothetical protein AB0M43_35535 [Longispora sp. NPDC051575]|uniref:hypothetical protein n=1 Tax=Longispora sp. NPDC051575 TaxID=3154943 RepID=UPI00342AFE36
MDDATRTALSTLLAMDATLAAEPDRLGRALTDLLPHDDHAVWLLSTGARFRLPTLLGAGTPDAVELARNALVEQAGLRSDVAAWVAHSWSAALGGHPTTGPVETPSSRRPGPATAVRLAVWPDGSPLLAAVTDQGVFLGVVNGSGAPAWLGVATPTAPNSRDVAIVVDDVRGSVSWSDSGGVHTRRLARMGYGGGGADTVALSGPQVLVPAREPRYPLVVRFGTGGLDVLWAADRSHLRRSLVSDWAPDAVDAPAPQPGDLGRLTAMDLADGDGRTAWLAALTDRGHLLVSRWDLPLDDLAQWTAVPTPVQLVGVAVAARPGGAVVLGCTAAGHLLAVDARSAHGGTGRWRTVSPPDGVGPLTTATGLAAGSAGAGAWLAVLGTPAGWLAPVRFGDDEVLLGAGRPLGLTD